MYVALPWQVYELSNVPTAMGIVGTLQTGALVAFLLIGGVVADRFERRRVIVIADLVRSVAAAVIGLLGISGHLELWHVFVLATTYGVGMAFAGPATGSIVPDLVPREVIVQANSALFTMNAIMLRFAGPALGGVLVAAFGAGTAFLIDAGSFVVGALLIGAVSARGAARVLAEGETSTVLQDLREGFAYVRSHTWLWGTLLWALLVLPLTWGPYVVLLPYLVKNELGGGAADLGLVFAFGGAGSVLMSLVISQLGIPRRHITFMYATFAWGAIDLAIFALTQAPWQAMVVSLVTQCGWAAGLLVWNPLLQRASTGSRRRHSCRCRSRSSARSAIGPVCARY
jgi:MFS family permease